MIHNVRESEHIPSDRCSKQRCRSACAFADYSECLPETFWITKNVNFLQVKNEDSDQTVRMCRLIYVFIGSSCQKVCFLMLQLYVFCFQ